MTGVPIEKFGHRFLQDTGKDGHPTVRREAPEEINPPET